MTIRSRFRRLIKEQVARRGGRFRPFADTLSFYLQFGDWLKQHECEVKFGSRRKMYDYINEVVLKNAPIDYLEFGVYEGDSIGYWAGINRSQDSRFFGFD